MSLERGAKLGRYMLLSKLGEGGMGVVYGAYDPELDRKVALKILSARISSGTAAGSKAAQARLLREAQAMARVKHPNVITVYDVGTIGRQVFVAMELVDDGTLGRWFRNTPRTWKEILRTFMEAGKGLAAAHAAGLVHRDFKPDNVLISKDGRVQVTDFGLARLVDTEDEDEPSYIPPRRVDSDERRLIETQLTQVGAVVGTPAYMPPEQHLGKVPDARSDQFSFCAALYFALFTVRPFDPQAMAAHAGRILDESSPSTKVERATLRRSTGMFTRGIIKEPPREPKVPAWVRSALMHGLAVDPNDRFSSMEELLKELESAPLKRQRRLYAAGGVGAAGLVAAAALAIASQRSSLCRGADRKLEGVWDEPTKVEVMGRIRSLNKSWAAETASAVDHRLGKYAGDWASMFQEACEATRVRGEQSESVMSLRMICLDKRLREMGALTRLLKQGDDQVLAKSVDAVHALSSLNGCADIDLLTAPVSLPEDKQVRERIEVVGTHIAEAKALHDAGKFKPALEIAEGAAADARVIGYAPLIAEALRWRGWLLDRDGKYKEGEQSLRDAVNAADSGRADEERLRDIFRLIWAVGYSQGRFEEGLQWVRAGEALLKRIGGNEELEMDLHNMAAAIHMAQGKYAEALAQYQLAVQLSERVLGADDPARARYLGNLGAAQMHLGNKDEALKLSQQSLAMVEASLGRDHPTAAPMHQNLAKLLTVKKDYDGALAHAKAAVHIFEQANGPKHPKVADAMDNVVIVLQSEGYYQEALDVAQRSLEIRRKTLGEDHPSLGYSYENIGEAYLGLKQYDRAIDALERSLSVREPFGVAATELAEARFALAQSLWLGGRDKRRARTLARQARDGYDTSGDKEHLAEVVKWIQERPEEK
jgi:tetratricopeptide (TPR) repeat protein